MVCVDERKSDISLYIRFIFQYNIYAADRAMNMLFVSPAIQRGEDVFEEEKSAIGKRHSGAMASDFSQEDRHEKKT